MQKEGIIAVTAIISCLITFIISFMLFAEVETIAEKRYAARGFISIGETIYRLVPIDQPTGK